MAEVESEMTAAATPRGRAATRLVIFDLDGTLLNTIADLAAATNYALARLGYPVHAVGAYPAMVGHGIRSLFERALPAASRTEANVERVRRLFVPYYDLHNADESRPYDGVCAVLHELHRRGVSLAVASNKYQAATVRLVRHFFGDLPFAAVYGQREGVPTKPDPTIVDDILRQSAVTAAATLYVGDSGVDMQTAAAAGVAACGVTWGFRPRADLEAFRPAWIIDRPAQLLDCIAEA